MIARPTVWSPGKCRGYKFGEQKSSCVVNSV